MSRGSSGCSPHMMAKLAAPALSSHPTSARGQRLRSAIPPRPSRALILAVAISGIVMIPPQFGDDTPRTDTCIWSCISMYLGRIPQVGRVLCDPHMIHVSPHLMHAVEASSRYIQNTFIIHLEKRRSMLQYMLAEIHQYHTQY